MALLASRTQSIVFGSSRNLAAVLAVLACWTSVVGAASIGNVCVQDSRPQDGTVWNANPANVNVTVRWTVERVIYAF